jgi:hypothetical protein
MRLLTVFTLTIVGVLLAQVFPIFYVVVIVICWLSFTLLAIMLVSMTRSRLHSGSLRHAVLGSLVCSVIVTLVSSVVLIGDVDLETRMLLRNFTIAVAAMPPLFWLILLLTGGFNKPPLD